MTHYISSTIPFIQASHTLGKQKPKVIELRSSFTTSVSGAALGLANYWHSSMAFKHPSHYVVDESNIYQCIPDNVVADSYSGDKKGILLITVCSEPLLDVRDWRDQSHQAVFSRTFKLIYELSERHHIPLRYLNDDQISRWYKFRFRKFGGVIISITGTWPSTSLV